VALEHILSPITINGLEIKNRIARAAHGTSYGRGTVSEDLIAYHEARARSGVGLNILEATVVHRSSANHTVDAVDDSIVPAFAALAKACSAHGMKTFVQLWHGGHRWAPANGMAPLSASDVPCPLGITNTPQPMTLDQIEEIKEAFAAAAGRVRESGLDGIEIHAGHGYLFHQFLNPLTNRREDGYGGSLDNRMRFLAEVLAAVRARVGDDYPLGIRISDYNIPGGFSPEEAGEVVARLCEKGLTDYVSGSMGSPYSIDSMLGCMDRPSGYMLSSAEPIVQRSTVPTMIAGRFGTLDEGDEAIRTGLADMVSYVRAMIADEDMVAKSARGEALRVRPCISCNQGCVGGIRTPVQRMTCTVNPAVGFERTLGEHLIVRTERPQKVVVVGGGPGGMEAARMAALHGHDVVLLEAQPPRASRSPSSPAIPASRRPWTSSCAPRRRCGGCARAISPWSCPGGSWRSARAMRKAPRPSPIWTAASPGRCPPTPSCSCPTTRPRPISGARWAAGRGKRNPSNCT